MGDTKTVNYYKIRNKSNPELFHKGGIYNQWSKVGKVWSSLSQLRSMITMNMDSRDFANTSSDWEIVEYEVREIAVKDVHEVVSPEKLIKILTK